MGILNKKYLGSASMMLQELFDGVSSDEKQQMKSIFDNLSQELYHQYLLEVQQDILTYISSTPEERNTNWIDLSYKLKLHYFSFIYLQHGYLLMRRLAAMPNKNGIRRVPAFFSVMSVDIKNKIFKDSIFNDELSYEDFA
ncbi:MAG: hypothetical protein HOP31_08915 [Ignavibacteria bacterium]|nr:hypothetical protein [Ignavibacteria bacterium]